MSVLKKLTVSGIRSFSPDGGNDAKSTIQFSTPVTLIVGQNGCGKTTIIEAIRYAITGQVPPGTHSGKLFINDPKMTNSNDVLARIQLELEDQMGRTVICTRKMKLQATRGKKEDTKFSTLEGSLQVRHKNGETTDGFSKCIDMKMEMCDLLGVSEAILNNVIFCHQEDSCWPLDEGKAVKERFDAIFNTTGYMLSLKVLEDRDKELGKELRVQTEAYTYAKRNMEILKKKKNDLADVEAQLQEAGGRQKEYQDAVDKLQEEVDKLKKGEERTNHSASELATSKEKIASTEAMIKELEKRRKSELEGSADDLRARLEAYQEEVQEKLDEQKNVESELKMQMKELQRLQEKRQEIDKEDGRIQEAESANEQRLKKIQEISVAVKKSMEKFVNNKPEIKGKLDEDASWNQLSQNSQKSDGVSADSVLRGIASALKIIDDIRKDAEEEFEDEEALLATQIVELMSEKASADTEIKIASSTFQENKGTLNEIVKRLDEIENSSETLAALDDEEEQITAKLQRHEKSGLLKKYEDQIKQHSNEIQELEAKIAETEIVKDILAEDQSKLDRIEMLKKQKQKKQNECSEFMRQKKDHLENLLGTVQTESRNLRKDLANKVDLLSKELTQKQNEVKKVLNSESKLNANLQQVVKQLSSVEEEIQDADVRVAEVIDESSDLDFEDQFKQVVEDIENKKKSTLYTEARNYLYETQLKQMKKKNCCPLCKQKTDKKIIETVAKEFEKSILETSAEQIKDELDSLNEELEKWQSVKVKYDAKTKLQKDRLPALKKEKASLDKQLTVVRTQQEELEDTISTLSSDLFLGRDLLPGMAGYEKNLEEMRQLQDSIKAVEAQRLDEAKDAVLTLEEAKEQLNACRGTLSSKRRNRDKIETDKMKLSDDVDRLKQKKNQIHEKKLNLRAEVQNRDSLLQQKNDLEKTNSELQGKLQSLKKSLPVLQGKIRSAEQEKEGHIKRKNEELGKIRGQIDEFKRFQSSVLDLKKQNADFEKVKGQFHILKQKGAKLKETVVQREAEVANTRKQLDDLLKQIASSEIEKRNILDNLSLKEKTEELRPLHQDYQRKKKVYDSELQGGYATKRTQVSKQFTEALIRLQNFIGGQAEVRKRKVGIIKEIEEEHKTTERDFRDRLIKKTVYEKAQFDVRKYRKALDMAIMTFHKKRMETINRYLRRYWQAVYKGNDIDYIQIKTEEITDSSKTISLTEQRRKYNYRVVMVRNNVELDMRGRCSAGQKMLASILIRICLAETFSTKCGIISLDEPTTNLDSDNIRSLAACLSELAQKMALSKTFQLLVITHDHEFMDQLLEVDAIEFFHKVYRDEKGFSKISQIRKE